VASNPNRGSLLCGRVTPPADMIGQARKELRPKAFEDLMRETGGAPPSPAQLVKYVEQERAHGT
jgi:hypothetical protein